MRSFVARFCFLLGVLQGLFVNTPDAFAQTGSSPTPLPAPVVTIVATDPFATASDPTDTGTFTVSRTGSTSNSLAVFYSTGGTASNGVDYASLLTLVDIPGGSSSATITVAPLLGGGAGTVVLRLIPSPLLTPAGAPLTYVVGNPGMAEVLIRPPGSPTNLPPFVSITSPPDDSVYAAPASIPIIAAAHDPDGSVRQIEFFANDASLGVVSNFVILDPIPNATPIMNYPIFAFFLNWTNVPPGAYALTAVATDDGGASTTSAPVHVSVTGPTPPVVSIFAPDPVAVEGTNFTSFTPATVFTNYCGGTNTATFLVRRTGDTSSDLTVLYSIGGTASNGVDYVKIPNTVTIPAGRSFALITIIPLEDVDPDARRWDTVILALTEPPDWPVGSPPPYIIGRPAKAAAVILEDRDLPNPVSGRLPGDYFHAAWPFANGLNICVEVTTNLTDWTPVCTNTVVKEGIHFVDPDAGGFGSRYYRAVQAGGPPSF